MSCSKSLAVLCLSLVAITSPLRADDGLKRPAQGAEQYAESGSLSRQDDRLTSGEYVDWVTLDLRAGDVATIDLNSWDFDTYLMVRCDQDESLELDNDDHLESLDHSQIIFEAPVTGTYNIGVTSYEPREMGHYDLSIQVDGAVRQDHPGRGYDRSNDSYEEYDDGDQFRGEVGRGHTYRDNGGPRILGIFVGIGDYAGTDSDLHMCDQDAINMSDLMQSQFGMQSEDAVVLMNEEATVDNVLWAIQDLGGRARPQDTLVFFYSGHGGQWEGSSQQADPDGIHETLSLYDGTLIDDDFADAFNASPAGIALMMVDSCFSGGFAKDVVSAEGRMGIFSSEEDVQSMNPGDIPHGGYLSMFLMEALSDDQYSSDANGDGQLTAHELSHYLGERYREVVRSDYVGGDYQYGRGYKSGTPISPLDDLSFQRLVIDRGGVSSDSVLFTWR